MNEGDNQIACGGHHLGSIARMQARAVFAETDIAHVVQSILDMPMAAVQLEQTLWASLLRRQGGDEVDDLPLWSCLCG